MKPATVALVGLAVPVLLSTVVLMNQSLAEGLGLNRPAGPLNSAEAAGIGNPAAMLQFIHGGEDPTRVYALRPEVISSTIRRATTLEAAMWARQISLIQLLDREGVIVGDDQRRFLACLAADLGLPEIVAYLAPQGATCVAGEAHARVLARTPHE
jgi:hypothetical protein